MTYLEVVFRLGQGYTAYVYQCPKRGIVQIIDMA